MDNGNGSNLARDAVSVVNAEARVARAAEAYYDAPSPAAASELTRAVVDLKDARWVLRRQTTQFATLEPLEQYQAEGR